MGKYDFHVKEIKERFGNIDDVFTLRKVVEYVKNENIAQATKNMRKAGIKEWWWETHEYNKQNWADLEWELKNIKISVNRNPMREHITNTKVCEILSACRSEKQKLFIEFLAKTGVRITELINIKLSDCRTADDVVSIKVVAGKTGAIIYKEIERDLYNKIIKEFGSSGYLFSTSNGKRYTRSYISGQISKIGKTINSSISPQSFRAYYITKNINDGGNIVDISRNVGHVNIGSTVQRYYTGRTG